VLERTFIPAVAAQPASRVELPHILFHIGSARGKKLRQRPERRVFPAIRCPVSRIYFHFQANHGVVEKTPSAPDLRTKRFGRAKPQRCGAAIVPWSTPHRSLPTTNVHRNLSKQSLRSKTILANFPRPPHLQPTRAAEPSAAPALPPPPLAATFFRACKRKGHVWSKA
jgi:hypothetical protein